MNPLDLNSFSADDSFEALISTSTGSLLPNSWENSITQRGTAGNDTITGTGASDIIVTFQGNDGIDAGSGNDRVHAGQGDDIVRGGLDSDILFGGLGNDTITGDEGRDVLYGNEGEDSLIGGEESDTLFGGQGNDVLYGVDGNDRLEGNRGDDTLIGGANEDRLYGGQGNDVLAGDEGNDVLVGGIGFDTLTGGLGIDVYAFRPTDTYGLIVNSPVITTDVIVGFNADVDKIAFVGITDTTVSVKSNVAGAAINLAGVVGLATNVVAKGDVAYVSVTGSTLIGHNYLVMSNGTNKYVVETVGLTGHLDATDFVNVAF